MNYNMTVTKEVEDSVTTWSGYGDYNGQSFKVESCSSLPELYKKMQETFDNLIAEKQEQEQSDFSNDDANWETKYNELSKKYEALNKLYSQVVKENRTLRTINKLNKELLTISKSYFLENR